MFGVFCTQRNAVVSCEVVNQADGLLVELMLSSCYDFVEQSCDLVLKHLSIMQKQRYGLLFAVTIADELFCGFKLSSKIS